MNKWKRKGTIYGLLVMVVSNPFLLADSTLIVSNAPIFPSVKDVTRRIKPTPTNSKKTK